MAGAKQSFFNSLFRWTMKNTDDTTNTVVPEIIEERKIWLSEALTNMSVNPVDRLKWCIEIIKNSKSTDEEIMKSSEELNHWTEELDLAKDFFTVGGGEILPILLDHVGDEIRIQGCSLIANLVQNNDHCQRIVIQSGILQKLLLILDQSENDDVRTKSLTAISALIRGYTLGQLQFQKFNGFKIVVKALSAQIPRLQLKICFLVNTLSISSQQMKKLFYENGTLDELINFYVNPTCPDPMHVVEAILSLSDAKKDVFQSLKERNNPLFDELEKKLNQRLEIVKSDAEQNDEKASIYQLLTFIQPSSSTVTTSTDSQVST